MRGLSGLLALLLLIRGRSVIRGVEPGPLEDDPRAAADQPAHLPPALGTALPGRLGHGLEHLEAMTALLALVLVRRHRRSLLLTFDPERSRADSGLLRCPGRRWRTTGAGDPPCRTPIRERRRSSPRRSGNC